MSEKEDITRIIRTLKDKLHSLPAEHEPVIIDIIGLAMRLASMQAVQTTLDVIDREFEIQVIYDEPEALQ